MCWIVVRTFRAPGQLPHYRADIQQQWENTRTSTVGTNMGDGPSFYLLVCCVAMLYWILNLSVLPLWQAVFTALEWEGRRLYGYVCSYLVPWEAAPDKRPEFIWLFHVTCRAVQGTAACSPLNIRIWSIKISFIVQLDYDTFISRQMSNPSIHLHGYPQLFKHSPLSHDLHLEYYNMTMQNLSLGHRSLAFYIASFHPRCCIPLTSGKWSIYASVVHNSPLYFHVHTKKNYVVVFDIPWQRQTLSWAFFYVWSLSRRLRSCAGVIL